jgi:hypothetical protein
MMEILAGRTNIWNTISGWMRSEPVFLANLSVSETPAISEEQQLIKDQV